MTTGAINILVAALGKGLPPVFGNVGVLVVVAWVLAAEVTVLGQDDELTVSVVVLTVPPKARARPVQTTVLPIVIPEASITVPPNVELAPSVVAAPGVHQTLQAEAPPAIAITELLVDVRAPVIRKM